MPSGDPFRVEIPLDDPDEPITFAVFACVASAARHRPVEIWVAEEDDRVPYGMWWDELRPLVTVHRGTHVDAGHPDGCIWLGPDESVPADDPRAAAVLATLGDVAWLEPT